jgi:hypothetical protein
LQIKVVFAPTTADNATASLEVADNAVGNLQTLPLSGTGTAAPDFTVGPASESSNSANITAGQTASFNLMVTPAESFSGEVSLSCAIVPAVTSQPLCTVPASVNVTQGHGRLCTGENIHHSRGNRQIDFEGQLADRDDADPYGVTSAGLWLIHRGLTADGVPPSQSP